jgi:hypothetical protein
MTAAERIAYEHGGRIVLDRRERETHQRRAFRAYVDGESQANLAFACANKWRESAILTDTRTRIIFNICGLKTPNYLKFREKMCYPYLSFLGKQGENTKTSTKNSKKGQIRVAGHSMGNFSLKLT